jgi:hypothetical protein
VEKLIEVVSYVHILIDLYFLMNTLDLCQDLTLDCKRSHVFFLWKLNNSLMLNFLLILTSCLMIIGLVKFCLKCGW